MSFNIGLSGIGGGLQRPERHRQQHRQRRHRRLQRNPARVRRHLRRLGAGFGRQPAGQRRAALGCVSQMFKQGASTRPTACWTWPSTATASSSPATTRAIAATRAGYFKPRPADFIVDNNLATACRPGKAGRTASCRTAWSPARSSAPIEYLEHPAVVQPQLDAEAADRDAVRSVRRRYLQLVHSSLGIYDSQGSSTP